VTMNEIIERLEAEVELIAEWHHSDHANYGLHIKPPHIRAILAALKAGQALADAVWAWHAVYEQAPEHKDATWLNELMAAREDIWAALAAYPGGES
jgi:hypothetical protein